MPVLRSKKKSYYHTPEDYELFCGEEMKPYVAYELHDEEKSADDPIPIGEEPATSVSKTSPSISPVRRWLRTRLPGLFLLK